MSTIIESIERRQLRQVPRFDAGDRVRVHFQVVEGERRRTQVFEGIVIKRQGSGARETFTVRKQSFGVGVERTFPVHSPKIEQLEVAARGAVRRAKLYYLRDRVGKAARVAERRWGIKDELVIGEAAEGDAVDGEGVAQVELDEDAGAEAEGEPKSEADETETEQEAGVAEPDDAEKTPEPAAASETGDEPEAEADDAEPEGVTAAAEQAGDDASGETDATDSDDAEAEGGAGAEDSKDR